jgi:hypothetical protein
VLGFEEKAVLEMQKHAKNLEMRGGIVLSLHLYAPQPTSFRDR